jgi:spore germination cell wall hydrolase CwlJ-like protein
MVPQVKAFIISFFIATVVSFGSIYLHRKNEAQAIPTPQTINLMPDIVIKSTISPKDILCLKQNIHYEADGEPFRGKVAIAIVTLNRTNILNKTICKVVFEPKQFSWTINKKKLVENFSDDVNFAANIVLSGHSLIEELKYATNFHEAYTYPAWAKEKRKITTIGNHVFYSEK